VVSGVVNTATSVFLVLGLLRMAWAQRHHRYGKE
jgi:hypothetical protein